MINLFETTNWKRLILAFLIAPWMTPLMCFMNESISSRVNLQLESFVFFLYVGLIANVAMVIFGIPAYLIYRKFKWSNILLFVLGGGIIGYIVSFFVGPNGVRDLLDLGRVLYGSMGALSALAFRLILGIKQNSPSRFVVHISLILMMFSILNVQAQSNGKSKPIPPSTATQPKKIQGWAVKVIGFENVRFEYVTFNSGGVGGYYRTHWMGVTGYRRPPAIGNILSSTVICTFNLSEKLANETKSVMANLHPQNWKEVYGSNLRYLRPIVTIFYTDGTSAVYQTTWKVSKEIPNDLSQILGLRDKVFDQRICR
jgi:hypothetical protein